MARPLRIEFPGALYHVTARGNARQDIFLDDEDRQLFLRVLGKALQAYNGICHSYCLMSNHYHLLIETPDANLSLLMKQINGVYTQRSNKRHSRTGHVFQGRFKAIVVDKDEYLLQLCRYIVLNPVRAGMVNSPGKHRWSSYAAIAGKAPYSGWLHTDWVLSQFGKKRTKAQDEYRKFVLAGIEEVSPLGKLKERCILGGKKFVESLLPHLKAKEALKEFPVLNRLLHRPSLETLFPEDTMTNKTIRNSAMRKAHFDYGYKQKEIADHLSLHYTTISNILRKS